MIDFRSGVSLPVVLAILIWMLTLMEGWFLPFSIVGKASGLSSDRPKRQVPRRRHRTPQLDRSDGLPSGVTQPPSPTRRGLLTTVVAAGGALAVVLPYEATAAELGSHSSSSALFRPNPLTNPFLEQVRIWEQAEADELRYGGELERGDAGNRGKVEAYPSLLAPIVQISDELSRVGALILRSGSRPTDYEEARRILSDTKYQKIVFKKTFNRYGDNIYYADPDRANLYLGGGATPKTEQSLAYLLRNDILTNVEALQAELDYLLAHPEDESTEDLRTYAQLANQAMHNYLDLVPPRELEQARALLAGASTASNGSP